MNHKLHSRWLSFVSPTSDNLSDVEYCLDALVELLAIVDLSDYCVDAIGQSQVVIASKFTSAQALVSNINDIVKASNEVIPAELLSYVTHRTRMLDFVQGTTKQQQSELSSVLIATQRFVDLYCAMTESEADKAKINLHRIRPTLRHLVLTLHSIAHYINGSE